jgi:cysteine desulfurase
MTDDRTVYLDHNATTPVRPAVVETVTRTLAATGNPSSVHRFGRLARKAVEDARERVAALVGATPAQVVFTSGGSEANNLALRGSGRRRILVSAVEHDSVFAAVPGAEVIPVDQDGVVNLAALEGMLAASSEPAALSVMTANNETGVLQPVAQVAEVGHRFGALVHTDAVQAAGRIPVDLVALGVDLLTLSAHKMGGPQGVGALVAAENLPLVPLLAGGGQERGRRPGTENVAGIAGFGVAAELAAEALADSAALIHLRDRLEAGVRATLPSVPVYGSGVARLPNTSCLGMPGVAAETQVVALDLAGVMVSAGAACSAGKVRRSRVLAAMGVGEAEAASAIRISLGWTSTAADVECFVAAWRDLYRRAGARAAA